MDSLIGTGSAEPNDTIPSNFARDAATKKRGLKTLENLTKQGQRAIHIEVRNACIEEIASELIELRT